MKLTVSEASSILDKYNDQILKLHRNILTDYHPEAAPSIFDDFEGITIKLYAKLKSRKNHKLSWVLSNNKAASVGPNDSGISHARFKQKVQKKQSLRSEINKPTNCTIPEISRPKPRNRRYKRKSASVSSPATINIHNLLNVVLSSEETLLIQKGLNYCITIKAFDHFQLAADVDDVIRSYRLKDYFSSFLSESNGHHDKSQNTGDTELDYNVLN